MNIPGGSFCCVSSSSDESQTAGISSSLWTGFSGFSSSSNSSLLGFRFSCRLLTFSDFSLLPDFVFFWLVGTDCFRLIKNLASLDRKTHFNEKMPAKIYQKFVNRALQLSLILMFVFWIRSLAFGFCGLVWLGSWLVWIWRSWTWARITQTRDRNNFDRRRRLSFRLHLLLSPPFLQNRKYLTTVI